MQAKQLDVCVETVRHRITGVVTLPADTFRFSDLLNDTDKSFLALADVTIEPLDGRPAVDQDFVAVARGSIIYAIELSEEQADESRADDVSAQSASATGVHRLTP